MKKDKWLKRLLTKTFCPDCQDEFKMFCKYTCSKIEKVTKKIILRDHYFWVQVPGCINCKKK